MLKREAASCSSFTNLFTKASMKAPAYRESVST